MEQLLEIRSKLASKNIPWDEFDAALKSEQMMILRRIIRREYNAGNHLSHLKEIEDKQKTKLEKDPYWWITINPNPKVSLNELKYKVESFVKRKIVSDYIYVYEQRGKSAGECGRGYHSHILIRKNVKTMPTMFKRDIKSTFKSITDVNNTSIFMCKACPKKYIKDKYNYLLGYKTGDNKDLSVKLDIEFRKKNNLNKIYFSSFEPFGLAPKQSTE